MASYWFNAGADELAKSTITWTSDTIKARLVSSLPARTITSMTGITALTGATDQTLGTKSIVKDDTNNQVKYVAANPTFSAVTTSQTVAAVVVFKYGTGDADSIPLCVHDVTDTPTNGGDITIDWPIVNSTDGTVMYQTNS
jgi:hypothetical protein